MKRGNGKEFFLILAGLLATIALFTLFNNASPTGLYFQQQGFAPQLANLNQTNCSASLSIVGELYELTGNMACPGDGLLISADDIILDCNGFTITKTGGRSDEGIDLQPGTQNITVRNCSVAGFTTGIRADSTLLANITNNTVQNNTQGINTIESTNTLIQQNTAFNNTGAGINSTGGENSISILNNTATENGNGIALTEDFGSPQNVNISGNNASNNNNRGFTGTATSILEFSNNIANGNRGTNTGGRIEIASGGGGPLLSLSATEPPFTINAYNGNWHTIAQEAFPGQAPPDRYPTKTFILPEGTTKVALTHHGTDTAHLDALLLNGNAPTTVTDTVDGAQPPAKVSAADYDVLNALDRTIEATWTTPGTTLTITAVAEDLTGAPVNWPPRGTLQHTLGEEETYTYDITPVSSHPDKTQRVTLSTANNMLTVFLDWAGDNTLDLGGDWARLHFPTSTGTKTFTINNEETTWGTSAFEYTPAAPWQHKTYTFNIPLAELGARIGDTLPFRINYYGTFAGPVEPTIIENNIARNNNGDGWVFLGFGDVNFRNNEADNNGGTGLILEHTGKLTFENNIATNNRGADTGGVIRKKAASLDGGGDLDSLGFAPQVIAGADINITNNTAQNNNGTGWVFSNITNANFLRNKALNNTRYGFNLTNITNSSIEDNLAADNGIDGFLAGGSSTNLTFLRNNATGNNQSGFSLSVAGIAQFSNNRAENNKGQNTGGDVTDLDPLRAPPAGVCVPGAACVDDADCFGGICIGGVASINPSAIPGGFCDCGGVFALGPAAFNVQALANPAATVSNNIALNNNGIGWRFSGFNVTNFINNTATNSSAGIIYDNITLSVMEDETVTQTTTGIQLINSSNNSLRRTNINADNTWLSLDPSENNTLTNGSFNNKHGNVTFNDTINLSPVLNVSTTNLNIKKGQLFMNTTNLTEFNTTAHVQFLNVNRKNIEVAFDDTIFTTCNAPQCTNIILTGTTLDFDVASFTTYKLGTKQIQGSGGGGSNTPICPPSCTSLYEASKERFKQSPYCMQACPAKAEALSEPEQQQATDTQEQKEQEPTEKTSTKKQTQQTTTPEPEPAQTTTTEPVKAAPTVDPGAIKQQIKEQQALDSNAKALTYLFYLIALIALTGLWLYTHHKHLKE